MTQNSFFCIDGHTCGNPVRVVAGGGPRLEGATMMERRAHFLTEFDWVRTGLMFEPRGHDQMSGAILYPPTREDCDIGVLFIETSGCLPMCGHGTIGTVTIAIEHGLVTPKTPGVLKLDTPAGLVIAVYRLEGRFVEDVRLTNVPSFLHSTELAVTAGITPCHMCEILLFGIVNLNQRPHQMSARTFLESFNYDYLTPSQEDQPPSPDPQ